MFVFCVLLPVSAGRDNTAGRSAAQGTPDAADEERRPQRLVPAAACLKMEQHAIWCGCKLFIAAQMFWTQTANFQKRPIARDSYDIPQPHPSAMQVNSCSSGHILHCYPVAHPLVLTLIFPALLLYVYLLQSIVIPMQQYLHQHSCGVTSNFLTYALT